MNCKLVTYAGFVSGLDAYCETHFDPDYSEGGWSGYEGIYNATDQEVREWFEHHKEENK